MNFWSKFEYFHLKMFKTELVKILKDFGEALMSYILTIAFADLLTYHPQHLYFLADMADSLDHFTLSQWGVI